METAIEVVAPAVPALIHVLDMETVVIDMQPGRLFKKTKELEFHWRKSWFELGCMLDRIKQGIRTKEPGFKYDSFEDYVNAELRVGYAQARNFIKTYRVLRDNNIPFEKVAGLAPSVVMIAAPTFTTENVDAKVVELDGKSVKEAASIVAGQVQKDPIKQAAAHKALASKKANKAAAADGDPDVIDVQAKDIPNKPAAADGSMEPAQAVVEAQIAEKWVKALGVAGAVKWLDTLFPDQLGKAFSDLTTAKIKAKKAMEAKAKAKSAKVPAESAKGAPEQPAV